MGRCCCGQLNLEDDGPSIHNDYQHEVLGPEGNFCGPKINHDIRDLRERVFELEKELDQAHALIDAMYPYFPTTAREPGDGT